jgi:PIN domain nuclease of toxin-antitoxin system
MTYLLDTNALVWFETDDRRLGRIAACTISDAASAGLVSICPITGEDTIAMAQLPDFHADPADRLITAVAINAGLTLITSDRKILDWTGTLPRINLAL